jgi:uncharacterized protein YggU (UPF0235/DUF167 family)
MYLDEVEELLGEGKTNQATIKLLAEHFGIARNRILSGFKSKNKAVL